MRNPYRTYSVRVLIWYVVIVAILAVINATFRQFFFAQWPWFILVGGVIWLIAALNRPPELELNKEYPEPDEVETTRSIINLFLAKLKQQYRNAETLRDTHPKSNGLQKAVFEIEPDLPDELRVGLFAEAKNYDCWVRFSNSEDRVEKDSRRDFRGIAVKLYPVEGDKLLEDTGNTHDFLLLGSETFFAANPRDFFHFFSNLTHYPRFIGMILYFLTRPRLLLNSLTGRKIYGHPFEIQWFSVSPYKFGDRTVKYHLRSDWPEGDPDDNDPDYLRKRMHATLKEKEHSMDFMVQFQLDPKEHPIETTGVAWEDTPWKKVAKLRFPKQEISGPEFARFDENMTFNPWHCLPDHRPLGGINRARRDAMRAIQEFRLSQNEEERSDAENPPEA